MITLILALLWGIITCWRIRLLARFFQLEEYKNGRFLQWWTQKRSRLFPTRWVTGAASGFVLAGILLTIGIKTIAIHFVWWLIIIIWIAWPEPVVEIKKHFVATQRAKRLLGTAFVLVIGINVGIALLIQPSNIEAPDLEITALVGIMSFWLAPLFLMMANTLMYPVEETFRWRFRSKAKHRLNEVKPIVIGITGSYGKTSTKEYLAHILQGRFNTLATPKSYNTVMGVCITVNNHLKNNHEYFVVEMGAYVRGEIERICQLTNPQMGIIIAIGPQHYERFGSIETIVEAKYELIRALPKTGVGVFNIDDENVRGMMERGYPETRLSISSAENTNSNSNFTAENIRHTSDGLAFEVIDHQTNEKRAFHTKLVGLHNVTNILLATAVARHTGMTLAEIAMRVASLEPAEHRLKQTTLPNGITLLDDAYNTNPVGAVNALKVLNLYQDGRRVLVTPGMVELGDLQDVENEKLGQAAAQYCTDIILVGKSQTKAIKRGVEKTDFEQDRLQVVNTVQEAIDWYQQKLKSGDAILFLNDLADNYL